MKRVDIRLPRSHPQSQEALEALPADAQERIRQRRATYTFCCPFCMGMLPPAAKYCAWCARLVKSLAN